MRFDIKWNLVHQVYLVEHLSHYQLHFVSTFNMVWKNLYCDSLFILWNVVQTGNVEIISPYLCYLSVSNIHVNLVFPCCRPRRIFQPWNTGTASLVVNACRQCHRRRKSLRLRTSCFKIQIYWPLWSCFYPIQSWCELFFVLYLW